MSLGQMAHLEPPFEGLSSALAAARLVEQLSGQSRDAASIQALGLRPVGGGPGHSITMKDELFQFD